MSRIGEAFARAAAQRRVAFIPYLTAGDPSPARTVDLVLALAGCGADLIELGVPFSDPLADGEINQRAAQRALASGTHLGEVLEIASEVRRRCPVPLLLFSYFNPILRMGMEAFARRASAAGVDGVLATDLPVEEGSEYRSILASGGLEPIFMAAPTTLPSRLKAVGEASGGFVYYVSRPGVTGERDRLPDEARARVEEIRRITGKKVAVGFGISRREHVTQVASFADGVVIGSALVRVVEETGDRHDLASRIERKARELLGT
jgi:tryptophan synthase alpha chain